ncbi:ATP-binding cassette domain-containing protein [Flavobacteriaceae bacterium Ap0902]|nr:ATP-binding cassette domain-containing protein [Flavobacteriaceae bacterium Ap0902]
MKISIQNLTKQYGNQFALNNVSFDINQGEVIGLLGPNGAGKSTLMKCLIGSLNPTCGVITMDDEVIQKNELEAKKLMGYLPENNPLYTEMYVKEYLAFVADIRGLSMEEVHHVIEQVGLTPESSKKIKALSKGYKQRVGLAQAIIHQPEILILDEPTNGLDPNQIIEIRNLIRAVGQNKTVILSTHIMQEVAALCTRVVLLNQGEMLANKSIDEFKGDYNSLEDAFYDLTTK